MPTIGEVRHAALAHEGELASRARRDSRARSGAHVAHRPTGHCRTAHGTGFEAEEHAACARGDT